MSTNGIDGKFLAQYEIKLKNNGPKQSGITFELKSVFEDMKKQGLLKDINGDGLSKADALNLFNALDKLHKETERATNYTKMQVGQEFSYTAAEIKALAQAAGYEIIEDTTIPKENQKINTTEEAFCEQTPQETPIETPQEEQVIKAKTAEDPLTTGPKDDPEYEQNRLSLVEPTFSSNGQVGKIVGNQYYINNKEVSKEVFENAKLKAEAPANTAPQNTKNTEPMSLEQLEQYLETDTTYQGYLTTLNSLAEQITEAEKDGGFKHISPWDKMENARNRGDDNIQNRMNAFQDEIDNSLKESAYEKSHPKYKQIHHQHDWLKKDLVSYKKYMQNWQDGTKYESMTLNGAVRTNCEKITLDNGQRAWKTDQGTFLPDTAGRPFGNKVEK